VKESVELNSVYDFNRTQFAKAKPITGMELDVQLSNISGWFASNLSEQYYMLINHELRYFTTFNFINPNYHSAIQNIKLCLSSFGNVVGIDFNHESRYYEIWVTDGTVEGTHMFGLIPANDLVVEIA
jgi:hypothetical protein